MSIHSSLKTGGSLTKHRNVLSRTERLARLEEKEAWNEEENSVLGLPKVRNIKLKAKKKAKKDDAAEGEATEEPAAK